MVPVYGEIQAFEAFGSVEDLQWPYAFKQK